MRNGKIAVAFLIVFGIFFCPFLARGDYGIVINKNDNGGEATLRVGHVLEVRLAQPDIAGVGWQVVDLDDSLLELKSGPKPNAGLKVWVFKALKKGTTELKIYLKKPKDSPERAIQKYTVTLHINR